MMTFSIWFQCSYVMVKYERYSFVRSAYKMLFHEAIPYDGMKSGDQCCRACHEAHGSDGVDIVRCVVACCLVSSAAKLAMNGAEVLMYTK